MDGDRRKYMRFAMALPAEIDAADQDSVMGCITNFSRQGFCLVCEKDVYKQHAFVPLKIKNPLNDSYIDARAEIMWKRTIDGKCELGLSIVEIAPELKTEILEHGYQLWKKSSAGAH